jgi:hypothetical protein
MRTGDEALWFAELWKQKPLVEAVGFLDLNAW